MGWTLPDVWDLPAHVYEFVLAELERDAAARR
jgi:hypothetical protein